ncbi:MAG: SpoIIE family protein phosphatase [Alphaproteobacteria bacterium]|nr:SpoIIE family protein phosphatase [Alphaproteobacteria bacterium]
MRWCPCCGRRAFSEAPGSYDICSECGWEDDGVQWRWPWRAGGANHEHLVACQLRARGLTPPPLTHGWVPLVPWWGQRPPSPTYAHWVEGVGAASGDRVGAWRSGEHLVIAVADGAGTGTRAGVAAGLVVSAIGAWAMDAHAAACGSLEASLGRAEALLVAGRDPTEVAAVVVVVGSRGVSLAAKGDCKVFGVVSGRVVELTEGQRPRQALGRGHDRPFVAWWPGVERVVACSDGVWKYGDAGALEEALALGDAEACTRLVDSARLPTGALQDDCGVVSVGGGVA